MRTWSGRSSMDGCWTPASASPELRQPSTPVLCRAPPLKPLGRTKVSLQSVAGLIFDSLSQLNYAFCSPTYGFSSEYISTYMWCCPSFTYRRAPPPCSAWGQTLLLPRVQPRISQVRLNIRSRHMQVCNTSNNIMILNAGKFIVFKVIAVFHNS